MDAIRLATCTYQEFTPDMGTPVRTTAGYPRFALPYKLAAHAKIITPAWALVQQAKNGLAEDAYEFQYRRQLNEAGIDRIREVMTAVAGAYDLDSPVVLLCFDKLAVPGNWCHRTHFGRWYCEQTGDEVPELGGKPKETPHTLF